MIKTHDRGCEQLRLGPLPLCKQNENYCEMEQASLNTLEESEVCIGIVYTHSKLDNQPETACVYETELWD